MSVRIRLARGGTKKRPVYRIVAINSRSPRDGRFLEKLGLYNPLLPSDSPERVVLREERDPLLARQRRQAERSGRPLPRWRRHHLEHRAPSRHRQEGARRSRPRRPLPPPKARAPDAGAGRRRGWACGDGRAASDLPDGCAWPRSSARMACRARSSCAASPSAPRTSPPTARSTTRQGVAALLRVIGQAPRRRAGRGRRHRRSQRGRGAARPTLFVPRAALPEPAEDEFYHADLGASRVGSTTARGSARCAAVDNFGAGDVIEIAAESGAAC